MLSSPFANEFNGGELPNVTSQRVEIPRQSMHHELLIP